MRYDFTELDKVIRSWAFNKVKITATCSPELTRWKISINEEPQRYSTHLKNAVKWTEQQLKNWPECFQSTELNTWLFTNKNDAEKFITIFTLYQSQNEG